MSDIEKVMSVLEANEGKNFVQRILSPEKYPMLDSSHPSGRLKEGWKATHDMTWDEVEVNGKTKYRVYPNIVFKDDQLHWFDYDGSAGDYATETNEYIEFDDAKEADWFSQNYKLVWDH